MILNLGNVFWNYMGELAFLSAIFLHSGDDKNFFKITQKSKFHCHYCGSPSSHSNCWRQRRRQKYGNTKLNSTSVLSRQDLLKSSGVFIVNMALHLNGSPLARINTGFTHALLPITEHRKLGLQAHQLFLCPMYCLNTFNLESVKPCTESALSTFQSLPPRIPHSWHQESSSSFLPVPQCWLSACPLWA